MLAQQESGALAAPLAELKAYLRIAHDDEDAVLAGLLRGASALCEQFVGQWLIARDARETVGGGGGWPATFDDVADEKCCGILKAVASADLARYLADSPVVPASDTYFHRRRAWLTAADLSGIAACTVPPGLGTCGEDPKFVADDASLVDLRKQVCGT